MLREVNAGDKFGYRTALGEQTRKRIGKKGKLKIYELCRCICGKEKYVSRDNLFNGGSTSCSCMQYKKILPILAEKHTTHGMTNTRLFRIYGGMCTRCNNPNMPYYKNYGGRGIKCLRTSFMDFYNDMHKSYEEHIGKYGEENTTLDRINVNGDYCKENCRRATNQEQSDNRRTNHPVTYKGKEYPSISALSHELDLPDSSIHRALKMFSTSDEAIDYAISRKGKTFANNH